MILQGAIVLKSLREQVYDFLRNQLWTGAIEPGATLDLNALAEGLGVSRTPLRDALLQLEVDGFVTILPRRGVLVNRLSLEDIREIYQIIGSLESTALMVAAPRLGSAERQRMRQLDKDCRDAFESGDRDAAYGHNVAFHDVFLDHCGNARLAQIVRTKKQLLYDFQRKMKLDLAWERMNVDEHEMILDHLEAERTAEAAAHLREVHWGFDVQAPYVRAAYFEEA